MYSIYGEVNETAIKAHLTEILNQTFKMLPYKQYHYSCFESHTTSLLFRIRGISELFPQEPIWVDILANLQAAKTEEDFQVFRKAILDTCSLISNYQKQLGKNNA